VATARVRIIEDGPWWNIFAGDVKEGYIMTLGVSPSYRRKGLGTVLLRKICRILEEEAEVDLSSLHVQEINRAAVEFYKKNGFQVVEELPSHYLIEGQHYNALKMIQSVSHSRNQRCGVGIWNTISSCG
jgi:ribosomal protein S18 acetylase RimI-like enzyme